MDEKKLNLIYLVAKEYYIDEKKQKEIAEKYNINRVQVSRYITEAKKRGMVSIKVLNPLEDSKLGIKEKLSSFFPDLNVQIAVTHKRKEEYDFESLANKAIEYINESFLPNDKVGFGWGNTMYQIAKNFKTPNKYEDIIIVPLVGGSMKFENEFQTNNISFMIAEKFGGFNVPILAPFYVEDDLYPSFIKNDDVQHVLTLWGKLDKAVIGIGSKFSVTPLMELDVLSKSDLAKLLNFKQVGDILTHYFNLEGEICELDIYENLINLPIDSLKEIDEVIAVAGGNDKVEAIIGALRTGLIDTIILDNIVAEKILERL